MRDLFSFSSPWPLSVTEERRERGRERMDSPPGSARSSPEAEVGMRVEDLWDIQEAQLSPSEKLNSCFESIPVSSFPLAPSSQGISYNVIPTLSTLSPLSQLFRYHEFLGLVQLGCCRVLISVMLCLPHFEIWSMLHLVHCSAEK